MRFRGETRAIFHDLSKTFDTVWHQGLIHRLEICGLHGKILQLLKGFVCQTRGKRMILNEQCSTWDKISAGAPQGSELGPLFFLIYLIIQRMM